MPQSHSLVIVHIIFSTRARAPRLDTAIQPQRHAYLAATVRNAQCHCFRVGGTADHVHVALGLPRTACVADTVERIKIASSKWVKTKAPSLADFAWQRGYGAFSVSPKDVDALCAYIDRQPDHHRRVTFQEEYRMILQKYGIEFDERYVWD